MVQRISPPASPGYLSPGLPAWLRRLLLCLYPALWLIPASSILGTVPIFGDDHSSHLVAVGHLVSLLSSGETDLFCPAFNLGFPMYLYYQPLPHLVPALIHLGTGGLVPVAAAFNFTVVALFCLYPVTTYLGARWLGLGDAAALAAGALAPLVSSSLGFGFTLNSVMGSGLYTQTYAMVLLPLCLGRLWRYLVSGRGLAGAAGLLVLLFLSHAFYAVVAASAGVLMVLARPGHLRQATPRLAAAGVAALGSLLFWLLPLLLTREHMAGWPWGGEDRWLGYGAARILSQLGTGALLDAGRPPMLSLLALLGLALALRGWRRSPQARVLVLGLGLFIFFLMGRRTFSHLVDIQPANLGLQLFRYLGAVHLFAVLLAGLGLATVLAAVSRRAPPTLVVAAAALLLAWPVSSLGRTARRLFRTADSHEITEPHLRQLAAAIDAARAQGAAPGRVYAHGKTGHGGHLVSALLARYTDQPMGQCYGVSLHDSLGFYYLEHIKPTDAEAMALYNFRYVVARPDSDFARGKQPVFSQGNLALYILPGDHGYFMTLDAARVLTGSPRDERALVRGLPPPRSGGGQVLGEELGPNRYRARVRMAHRGHLALKVAHHPFWRVTVDGQPAAAQRLAPVFVGVALEPGEHDVLFRFHNPWWQKALLAASVAAWLLLGLLRLRRYQRRSTITGS